MPHKQRNHTTRRAGSISQTPNGRFIARIRAPRIAGSGKRGGISKVFDTKHECEAWLLRASHQTLEEFLRNFYENGARSGLAESTVRADFGNVKTYVFKTSPELAAMPLYDVTARHIGLLVAHLEELPIAVDTRNRVLRILRARFKNAVDQGLIRRHPMGASFGANTNAVDAELVYRIKELEDALRAVREYLPDHIRGVVDSAVPQ